MNLRTIVNGLIPDKNLFYKTKSIFIGSCFTEHIGNKLKDLKFNVDVNPFGVIYNPVSVLNSLQILIEKRNFTKKDLIHYDDLWHSFFHHSRFSNTDKDLCLQMINERIESSSALLKDAAFLFITFGTAWVYEYIETGQVVSNCHKIPANKFKRKILKVEEIVNSYHILLERLLNFNPDLKIIFTVSPVRHLKDGVTGNQISKSTLLLAISELVKLNEELGYFPAYEIMMDDLRDYRFYDDDLVHPNSMARKYIWEKFKESFIDKETGSIIKDVESIIAAKGHKPFNPYSKEHKKFLASILKKIEDFSADYPFIDLSEEKSLFSKELSK